MKQSLITLKSYFETGDRPTENEFIALIDSYFHKDDGYLIKSIVVNDQESIVLTFTDDSTYVIPKQVQPEVMPISFIAGLQEILDRKLEEQIPDADFYKIGTEKTPPSNILENIYTKGNLNIGENANTRQDAKLDVNGDVIIGNRKPDGEAETLTIQNDNQTFNVGLLNGSEAQYSDFFIGKKTDGSNAAIKIEGKGNNIGLNKIEPDNDVSVHISKEGTDNLSYTNPLRIDGINKDDSLTQLLVQEANGTLKYRDLSTLPLISEITELAQDVIANTGATNKIASIKAIEDFIAIKLSALIDNSPATLDTLNELSNALGDDENFAANITASLAAKLAAGTYTGTAADLDTAKRDKTAQAKSITDNGGNLELVGDVAAPVADAFYGTNAAGNKTFVRALDVLNFLSFKKEAYATSESDFITGFSIPTTYLDQDLSFSRDGKYVFICNITASSYETDSDFVAGIYLDDSNELDALQEEFKDAWVDQRNKRTLFGTADLTAGTHNFKLKFNNSSFSYAELHKAEVLIFKIDD